MNLQPSGAALRRQADGRTDFAAALPFALLSGEESLVAQGCRRMLAPADPASLARRVAEFFAGHEDGPRLLVGALPFDRARPAHLYQPAQLARGARREPMPVAAGPAARPRWSVTAEPEVGAYREAVARALEMMAASAGTAEPLRKIVLSRSLRVEADTAIDAGALVLRLAQDEGVAAFCVPLPPTPDGAPRTLVGATPELLLGKSGGRVFSHPLAGSARRHADARADEAAAQALLRSDKDRREHAEVVEAVLDQLAPYCRELGAPGGTELAATLSMWHLGTRIEGRLKQPETSSIELASLLHPTPAVCGVPREAAYRAIAALEPCDRDFYAGAVGWCDAAGDGRWHVAIRCAEIAGATARLYAGAGIVPGSDPAAEADETSAKFAALLHALGIDERGAPVRSPEAGA